MQKIRKKKLVLDQTGLLQTKLAECWQAHGKNKIEIENAIERWQNAFAPRLYRLDGSQSFDLAVVVPTTDESTINNPELSFSGVFNALIRLNNGCVYALKYNKQVLLEGDSSDIRICAAIQSVCEGKQSVNLKEWYGKESEITVSYREHESFPKVWFDAWKQILIHKLLAGNQNFNLPWHTEICPLVEKYDCKMLPNQSTQALYAGVSGPLYVIKSDFFQGEVKTVKLKENQALGESIIRINKNKVIDYVLSKVFRRYKQEQLSYTEQLIKIFKGYLNKSCVKIIESDHVENFGPKYNWMIADNDRVIRNYREQALITHPILVGAQIKTTATSKQFENGFKPSVKKTAKNLATTDTVNPILSCIDQAGPLTKVLSNETGLPEIAIRSLQGISENRLYGIGEEDDQGFYSLNFNYNVIELKKISDKLDRESWPSSSSKIPLPVQWFNLLNSASAINSSINTDTTPWSSTNLFSDINRSIQAYTPVWKTQEKRFWVPCVIDDMIQSYLSHLVIPVILDVYREEKLELDDFYKTLKVVRFPFDGLTIVEKLLTLDKTILQLAALSSKWCNRMDKIEAAIIIATDDREWPALFPSQETDGFTIAPITNAKKLALEGIEMKHCVASYVANCIDERCHILSVKDNQGMRISTVELLIENNNDQWQASLSQNKGPSNKEPLEISHKAVLKIVDQLNNGEIKTDWQGLEESYQERVAIKQDDEFKQYLGYDWQDKRGRNTALKAWSFCIPKQLRELDHDQWVEHHGLKEMIVQLLRQIKKTKDCEEESNLPNP